jgi:hypothetical protein
MKKFLTLKIMTLALVLLVASIPVAAVERPFAASGNGVATFITDEAGNIIGANITSSGTGTHIGRWTTTGTIHFTPDPQNPNLLHVTGEAPITAADGDKLNTVLENAVLDVTTGLATGQFRFVGGTGRFANATGITDVVVVNNLLTGGSEFTMVGKIDF